MEICRNNSWGTICDDGWDNTDARVVCRQLGLSVAGTYKHNEGVHYIGMGSKCTLSISFTLFTGSIALPRASFGAGTLQISYTNLRCTGYEARLLDCPHSDNSRCNHNEDAGVRCHLQTSEYELIKLLQGNVL